MYRIVLFIVVCCLVSIGVFGSGPIELTREENEQFEASASVITTNGWVEDGAYTIDIEYLPNDLDIGHKALQIWAEPSHKLLLLHIFGDPDSADFDLEGAEKFYESSDSIAGTAGVIGSSFPRIHFPYSPLMDNHIEVIFLTGNGEEFLASAPKLSPEGSFAISTSFEESQGGGGTRGLFKHCCMCGDGCGTMCVFCTGPEFECNCVWPICTIQCGWS